MFHVFHILIRYKPCEVELVSECVKTHTSSAALE